ncbi:xanthine dehydrogenase family protein molybdopterin-binding subunit [Jiella avicenniae]|uniref:Xanthine dehydrogenase family protein molybdopterin-binding subunit n=1 Tax=Jiella avicenniae TaxID=2907202 RepID=A0A9X1NZR6_9HYPH|nr:xanthine dehydrogenase family protein molybdopterin-binding subunit [Jiella avicenniae]MCE7027139.1 xanthine dehydrogenase family protein molybdopterin-binding subunit [Jiella avicenniae]
MTSAPETTAPIGMIRTDTPAIGRSMPRAETRRLLAGRGRYVDDGAPRGCLHAAFLRSPFAHARFTIADTSTAAGLSGVVAVLTAADLAPVCRPWQCRSGAFPGLVSPVQRALADGRVAFQGEPVAMVVAESRARAEDALDLIAVDWEELPAVASLAAALSAEALTHPELADNVAWRTEFGSADFDAVFAGADFVVEERFAFERKTGVSLEPRGVLAEFDPAEGLLDVRISHQMPHQLQLHIAEQLDLPIGRVRVACGDVGGGFGIKMHVYPDELATCAAAKLLGRPVKFVADRIEALATDIHAREHQVDARMAVDGEGRILGFDIHDVQGLGAYSVFPRSSTTEAMSVLRAMGGPYRFEAYRARLECLLQNKSLTGQYRSVGHPIACAVTERLVDLAAARRGEDPLAFRRRNLLPVEAMPWTNPAGGRMFELSHHACLDAMIGLVDLDAKREEVRAGRAAGRLLGLGFASFVEFTATGSQAYGAAGVKVAAGDTVVASLEPSGSVRAQASASEIGQGVRQALAQVLADGVGLDPSNVRVETGDTRTAPHGGGAWASRGAAIAGEAAWRAGRRLRGEILAAVAALVQAKPADLDIRAGEVVEVATGTPRMTLADLADLVLFRSHELPAGVRPQFTVAEQYHRDDDPFLPTNGIQAAMVEIDRATGFVRLLGHWVVEDCGRIINPLLVDEQIRGGVVQGIGEALYEACRYDAAGQFTSGTLADYLVPMAGDLPEIAIGHVETPYSGSSVGAKGAGEAGTCGAPAAILNAVNDALAPHGASLAALPIKPVSVLRALGDLGAGEAP